MQTQTQTQCPPISDTAKELFVIDLLRAVFMSRVAFRFIESVTDYEHLLPAEVRSCMNRVLTDISEMERRTKKHTSTDTANWLSKELNKEKLLDMATVIESVMRIGVEEEDAVYEEFLGILIDCISSVFYAQENRKNIHFSKYKALFKLIAGELKADTNHQPGQFWYRNNQIWLRSTPPEQQTQL